MRRSGEQLEAIAYARKYFANAAAASAEYMTMIKSAMASLAFPVDTDCEPYKVGGASARTHSHMPQPPRACEHSIL